MKKEDLTSLVLCQLSDLTELSSKGLSIKIKRKMTDIFVIRKNDQVYGYKNICPHAQAPLEWNPDEFLDKSKKSIICALHGARFSIEKGDCLGGPCAGVGLQTLNIEVIDGDVVLNT